MYMHVYVMVFYLPDTVLCHKLKPEPAEASLSLFYIFLKALGHDISKRFVTKFKRIVRRPTCTCSFR